MNISFRGFFFSKGHHSFQDSKILTCKMQIFAKKPSRLKKFVYIKCRFIVRIQKFGLFRVIKHCLASEFVKVLFKKHKIIINFSKKNQVLANIILILKLAIRLITISELIEKVIFYPNHVARWSTCAKNTHF